MAQQKTSWFKNKLTGSVQQVVNGTPEHRRMITTVVEKDDESVFQVWEPVDAPKTSTTKYEPGIQAVVHRAEKQPGERESGNDARKAPEAAGS